MHDESAWQSQHIRKAVLLNALNCSKKKIEKVKICSKWIYAAAMACVRLVYRCSL